MRSSRAPVSSQMRASPCRMASEGSEGVEGSLKRLRCPSRSKTKSVKVPPVSTPMRIVVLLANRYPAPTFIRSANCIKHELYAVTVLKRRRVFDGRPAGPQRFADRDRERGKTPGPASFAHALSHVILLDLHRTPHSCSRW